MHFFHSFWKNLHLTEIFYTDMSVVSVTNMRYVSNAIYMNWVGCSEAFFLFSHICTNLGGWNFSMSYELNDILGSANIDQYICPKQDILV